MFDYDAIIIGGGPAGLTAGLYLGRARFRTLLLEGDLCGGKIKNLEMIENYPGFADGVSGPQLVQQIHDQAVKYGLRLETGTVTGIEIYSGSKCITCEGGRSYTTAAIILAGGSEPKKLGVPGEKEFTGRGVFNCAFCDGGQFAGRPVAVCGGGDAGITEALYMTKLASRVLVLEALPALTASAILQERACTNPKLEVHCGKKVTAIRGDNCVKMIETLDTGTQVKQDLPVDGVLVHIGLIPNTSYLDGVVPLDDRGQVTVNNRMETEVPLVLAAGDIRSGSPGQVSTAVGDGATAAMTLIKLLQSGAC
jgi:thioredoxin reductase (NADPH)